MVPATSTGPGAGVRRCAGVALGRAPWNWGTALLWLVAAVAATAGSRSLRQWPVPYK